MPTSRRPRLLLAAIAALIALAVTAATPRSSAADDQQTCLGVGFGVTQVSTGDPELDPPNLPGTADWRVTISDPNGVLNHYLDGSAYVSWQVTGANPRISGQNVPGEPGTEDKSLTVETSALHAGTDTVHFALASGMGAVCGAVTADVSWKARGVPLDVQPVYDPNNFENNPPFLEGNAYFKISFAPPSLRWGEFELDIYREGANGTDHEAKILDNWPWLNGVITDSYGYRGHQPGEDKLRFVLTPAIGLGFDANPSEVDKTVSWGFDWKHDGTCSNGPPSYLLRNKGWRQSWENACSSDPVEARTGAFQRGETDAVLSEPGSPITFRRSYGSSLSALSGELGRGWSDNLSIALTQITDSSLFLRSEVGSEIPFTQQPDGSFSPPSGLSGTITKIDGGYELVRSDGSTTSFDAQGQLVSIADRNGNRQTFERDSDGLIKAAVDESGRRLELSRGSSGFLTKLTLPDRRSVSYGYTGDLLTSVTDVRGYTTNYSYDDQSRLVSVTDANGYALVTNTYGESGRIVSQTDALGLTTAFSYPNDSTTIVTDARGNPWRIVFDENGYAKQITNPDGQTTSYANNDAGNVISVTDALGNTLNIGYDSNSNPVSLSLPDGSTSSAVYNAMSDPTSLTDGRGNTTAIAYDAHGNPTLVTRADGSKASYSYDSHGLPVSYTNPSGATTSFSHDAQGNLSDATSSLGKISSYGYDDAGNATSFVDPRGNAQGANPDDYRWHESYDAAGELTSLTDPLGNRTTLGYDPVGNLTSRTDANGHTTTYAYDAANRLVTVTEPDNSTIDYTYDEVGNLITRTDGLTQTTRYAYDAENRPTVVTSPTGKIWSLDYDADGNLIVMHTPSSGTIGYVHDSLGRVTQVNYSDGTPSVSYGYDAAGNRVSMSDGSGTVRCAYDKLNRLASVDASAHKQSGAADSSASYAYDPSGKVTDRAIAGAKGSYSYNADGQLAAVKTIKPGKKGVVLETDYSYDAAGNLIDTTLPNGVVEARTYDRAGRLTSIHSTNPNGADVFGVDYTLDPAGNPTQADFDKPSGAERLESYSYDSLDRLTGYCVTAGCKGENKIAYSYDPAGDRLSETVGKNVTRYAYDASGELLSQTLPDGTKIPYSYDPNGNETGAGPWSYSYNLANQLTQAQNGSTTAAYSYDGDGNRLTEQISGSSPQTIKYLWDENFSLPQLAGGRDVSGSTCGSFIYGRSVLDGLTGDLLSRGRVRRLSHETKTNGALVGSVCVDSAVAKKATNQTASRATTMASSARSHDRRRLGGRHRRHPRTESKRSRGARPTTRSERRRACRRSAPRAL